MKRCIFYSLLIFVFVAMNLMSHKSIYANEGKDFMMSATYGLIAGTLVSTQANS